MSGPGRFPSAALRPGAWLLIALVFLLLTPLAVAAPVAKLTVVRPVVAGQSVNAWLNASGVTGTPTYAIVDQPSKGTATLANATTGAFTYAANLDANGRDTFTFHVTDDTGASADQVVYLTVHPLGHRVVAVVASEDCGPVNVSAWRSIVAVAAGACHTVGLKSDGTAVARGNWFGEGSVGGWSNIVAVAAGLRHTVGLQSAGTVVAVGDNTDSQLDVGGWSDIVAIAAGVHHTVGLKSDGSVVAVGAQGDHWNNYGQTDVSGWSDIVAVAAGYYHTVGLRSDGTVVAAGDPGFGQSAVGGWSDIVAIAAGAYHTVGLKSDGSVVAVGYTDPGPPDVSGMGNSIALAAGGLQTAGLRADGTVVAVGSNESGPASVSAWRNIVAVALEQGYSLGLQRNLAPTFTGTPAFTGTAGLGQTLSAADTGTADADGDTVTLSYQWQRSSDNVTFADIASATGSSHLLVAADAHAYVRVVVTADDGQPLNHSTARASTAVLVANTVPVANNDTALADIATATDISVSDNDADADGDTLTISALPAATANGAALVNHDTHLTYTGAPGWSGTDAFSYTVADGHGGTATADVTVHVYPPLLLQDGDGVPIPPSITLTSGHSLSVQIAGGSGAFLASVVHPDGSSDSQAVAAGTFELPVPTTGAFAGDYVVTLTDTVTNASKVVTATVPLVVEGERPVLLAQDPLRNDMEVTVRGAPAGSAIELILDGAAVAAGITGTASTGIAEDVAAEGNPARFIVATPDGLASTMDVALTAAAGGLAGNGTVTATPPITHAGQVFGPAHERVNGATVTLLISAGGTTQPWEDNLGRITATTAADGRFTLPAPPAASGASHSLQVVADGYAAVTAAAEHCTEAAPCALTLQAETTAATPTFSPGGGTFTRSVTVTIDTTTVGATLRYTLDETTPSLTHGIEVANGTAVTLTTSATLRAIAYKDGLNLSEVKAASYMIQPRSSRGGGGNLSAECVALLVLIASRRSRRIWGFR